MNKPKQAQIAIYFGLDRCGTIRAAAATTLARYASEWRRDRVYNPGLDRAKQIANRFKLADYYSCLLNMTEDIDRNMTVFDRRGPALTEQDRSRAGA